MTTLDRFQPLGEKIHPYDVYDLISRCEGSRDFIERGCSPSAIDSADYLRNVDKVGTYLEIKGKLYFQTTSVPFKSTSFKEPNDTRTGNKPQPAGSGASSGA